MTPTSYPAALSWDYVGLTEVRTRKTPYGFEVTLVCQQDEGSGVFNVRCERAHTAYLQPYTELLQAAADGIGEPPVIPIHSSNGYATFSVCGAEHDYPELNTIRQRRNQGARMRRWRGS